MSGFMPLIVDLSDKTVVVVGGGEVATRKAKKILKTGCRIRVICLQPSQELIALSNSGKIELECREYTLGDLQKSFMAIAATGNSDLDKQVITEAKSFGVLVNSVSDTVKGDVDFPAVVDRGKLLIAVYTSGASPATAKIIKEEIACNYGEEYVEFLEMMEAIRQKMKNMVSDQKSRAELYRRILASPVLNLIKKRYIKEAWQLINSIAEGVDMIEEGDSGVQG